MVLLISENIWWALSIMSLACTWVSVEIMESPRFWKLWKHAKIGAYIGIAGFVISGVGAYIYG